VPNKAQVFADAFRVLKPGGRLSVSDIVLLGEMPLDIRHSVEAYVSCLAGAVLKDDYLKLISDAGFEDVEVSETRAFTLEDVLGDDLLCSLAEKTGATAAELEDAASRFASLRVQARRPRD
jgi:ubiquinone/menaquinone biosynthesis C-methylase UbiE